MRTPRAPFLPALLLLGLAACGAEDGRPPVAAPVEVGPEESPGGAEPGDPQVPPESARSLSDTVGTLDRFSGAGDEIDLTLTSGMTAPRYRARFVPGYPGLVEFVLTNTGTIWVERFLLQMPPTPPPTPAPLLVVFHKFGTGHGDVLNTTFLAEAQARGWYCMSHTGARQKHFGSNESQINTRAALELVAHLFPIDRDRVYGVGFSMGGGALANYAARHQDPTGVRFAAIVNHTGGVSLAHTWFHEPDDADLDDNTPLPGQNLEVPDILEDLFGGPPSAVPFEYQRCSSIDLHPIQGTIGAGTDFARNLFAVPTLTWIASAEPLAYLATQTYAFDGHLQAQNVAHAFVVASGNVHAWTTLDETAVCDWLQTKTLQTPTAGRTLADENGRWLHFDLEQDAAGSFTPFTWSIDAAARRIELSQTANLRRVSIHAAAAGVAPPGTMTLGLATADGTGDRVRILGVAGAPLAVTRDGLAAGGTYDALAGTFEIIETDAARHEWVLTFP
ncbi:MAG: hypothetical protein JNK02_09790 [Planctomycetes bacterium]|nr:hypothetical protein [Planctomycetota bacterium]